MKNSFMKKLRIKNKFYSISTIINVNEEFYIFLKNHPDREIYTEGDILHYISRDVTDIFEKILTGHNMNTTFTKFVKYLHKKIIKKTGISQKDNEATGYSIEIID